MGWSEVLLSFIWRSQCHPSAPLQHLPGSGLATRKGGGVLVQFDADSVGQISGHLFEASGKSSTEQFLPEIFQVSLNQEINSWPSILFIYFSFHPFHPLHPCRPFYPFHPMLYLQCSRIQKIKNMGEKHVSPHHFPYGHGSKPMVPELVGYSHP